MILGEVRTFPDVRADKTQALKPLEEAAEVFSAWESWTECSGSADQILEEIADCITACCNLAAALGCDYMRPHLQEAEAQYQKGAVRVTRKVYAVIDSGGEWEDAWEVIVRVFASERLARECARKRIERNRDMDDYVTTRVEAVDFVEVGE